MKPEGWEKIKDILMTALGYPPEERAALLDEMCAGDPVLREGVASILCADERDIAFLDNPLLRLHGEEVPVLPRGTMIGPYRVICELGRGGMGAVYLASRADDSYDRRVAVKILKRGSSGEGAVKRFRNERQILADLDHPNIARLHDGGTTSDGRPYFVMEYIDGKPIDRYCEEHELSIAARLQLFRKICDAVHFAHKNLIIHRDIKPANILVNARGEPKLLDFGIAKLLRLQPALTTTRKGQQLMTPLYASPEQVRGEPITTASDVYALGVLLYRLLTGHAPYSVGHNEDDVRHAICTVIPEKASVVVTRGLPPGDVNTGRASHPRVGSMHRGTDLKQIRRTLEGDVDTILHTALRKEPDRRYQSVQAFSDDIGRHLEGLPVSARKETLVYLVSRFIRRYRLLTSLVALLFLTIIGFTATLMLQQRKIERERDRATRTADFLADLFQISDPYKRDGKEITARDLLEKAVQEIGELDEEPETQAALLDLFGRIYVNLGLFDRARTMLEGALRLHERTLGNEHTDVAGVLVSLALLDINQGHYLEAEAPARRAVHIYERKRRRPDRELADAFHILGMALTARGAYAEAEPYLEHTLEDITRILGPDHPEVATVLNNMSGFFNFQGRHSEAETALRRALAIQTKGLGSDHPFVATTMLSLSWALDSQGKFREALEFAIQSVTLSEKQLGPHHPSVALALNSQGRALAKLGEPERAEAAFRRSIEIYEQAVGPNHPEYAKTLNNLAALYLQAHRYLEAENNFSRLFDLQQKVLGARHPNLALYLTNLAEARHLQGLYPGAEDAYRRALSIREEALGPENPLVAESLLNLAELYHAWGEGEKLRALCPRLLALEILLPEHLRTSETLSHCKTSYVKR